jgi:hypothetical protein
MIGVFIATPQPVPPPRLSMFEEGLAWWPNMRVRDIVEVVAERLHVAPEVV